MRIFYDITRSEVVDAIDEKFRNHSLLENGKRYIRNSVMLHKLKDSNLPIVDSPLTKGLLKMLDEAESGQLDHPSFMEFASYFLGTVDAVCAGEFLAAEYVDDPEISQLPSADHHMRRYGEALEPIKKGRKHVLRAAKKLGHRLCLLSELVGMEGGAGENDDCASEEDKGLGKKLRKVKVAQKVYNLRRGMAFNDLKKAYNR